MIFIKLVDITSSGSVINRTWSSYLSSRVLNSTLELKASIIIIFFYDFAKGKCGRSTFGSGVNRIFERSCLFHLIMTDIDLELTCFKSSEIGS